jgi:uncharacterized protein
VADHTTDYAPGAGTTAPTARVVAALAAFAAIMVGGLLYAKWWPYAHKTATALATHAFSAKSSVTGGAKAPPALSWHAVWAFATGYFKAVWVALLAALVISSAMEALVPRRWLRRVLTSGPRFLGSAAAGAALAVPSMMCTCCTAPLAVTMRRRGVPVSSALAYWVGNPTLNPAVLVILAVVLPWQWVAVRITVGLVLVLLIPPLVTRFGGTQTAARWLPAGHDVADAEADDPVTARSVLLVFAKTLARLSATLLPEYLVIVLAIGASRGWLFPLGAHLASWGVLALLLLAVTGALFVVPTAGEIPVIQGLLQAGLGAGPVGVLVLTLPAVSLPSLAMIARSFPARVLVALFTAVVLLGICCGVLLGAMS